MADLQELLAALDVFSRGTDKAQIDQANIWLLDFQHSPEAWATANVLLTSPDAPPAAKLFAAQTFRSKVTYDLHQVDEANLPSLRDTLIKCVETYHSGPKTIMTQLCLALSGLALQFPDWGNAVQSLVDAFGRNPAMVPALLQFLSLLPEEITMNSRIPVTDEEYSSRSQILISDNVEQVMQLLSMYIHADGVTIDVQNQVLRCLRSWLLSGHVPVNSLATSPLFACVFDALDSEQLFDSAVDTLCDLIHETQEIDDDMPVIQLIVPRLIALRPRIAAAGDDIDKVKGFARIFTEAGEVYRMLILQHPETFFPIVEAVGECSAHPDFDVVSLTFAFWMRLSQVIGHRSGVQPVSPTFEAAFQTLMSVMIKHLYFLDASEHSSQEMDDFRSFRHNIGDTLKDCCTVLQINTCLMVVYDMIVRTLSKGESAPWQEIEAPMFAIRAMGGQFVPKEDSAVIPKILELIPSLPKHPQIRYTAILIISRYTEWTALHPQYIQAQLQYVSDGFQETNEEIVSASVLALRYICRDCKQHLTDFLATLHTFLGTTGSNLSQDHRREIYEATGHVISAMPMERAAESLRAFALDLLSIIHNAANDPTNSPESLKISLDALENLETLLSVIPPFGDILPVACQNTYQEAWNIFDAYLAKYGSDFNCSERATRVLRRGLTFFGSSCLPIASSVITRMALAFESTGQPGYLWIAGKVVMQFGNEEHIELRATFRATYETITRKMVEILQSKAPDTISGILEDYVHVIMPLLEFAPDVLFQSPAFHTAFKCCMASITVVYTDLVMAGLDIIRDILSHDCLIPNPSEPHPPKFPLYASAIRQVIDQEGHPLLGYLLKGLMGEFPEDATSSVISIFRVLCVHWPSQVAVWLPSVLQEIPTNILTNEAKTQFLGDVAGVIERREFDKVKAAVLAVDRAARKARERRRVTVDRIVS